MSSLTTCGTKHPTMIYSFFQEIEKYRTQIKELEERIAQLSATEQRNEEDKLNDNNDTDKK